MRNHEDGPHTIYKLYDNVELHRFLNAANCKYSAIYVGGTKCWSTQREYESQMILDWMKLRILEPQGWVEAQDKEED